MFVGISCSFEAAPCSSEWGDVHTTYLRDQYCITPLAPLTNPLAWKSAPFAEKSIFHGVINVPLPQSEVGFSDGI